jgi:glutaconate CoA-transferase subunit B
MDFDGASKRMRLKSLHPGVSQASLIENTGFELLRAESVQATPPPTEDELRLIREEIDTQGILQRI